MKNKIAFSIKTKLFFLIVIVGLLALVTTFLTFQFAEEELNDSEVLRIEKELNNLNLEVMNQLDTFEHDVTILSKSPPIRSIVESDKEDYSKWYKGVQDMFIAFSESKPWYMQIRYIDEDGQEIVRVDRKDRWSSVEIVSEQFLQNKKHRDYFQEAIILPEGSIYVTELDLNIERGQIERPFRPTIRYSTPVFDKGGNRRGIIIINILADNLLDFLSQSYDGLYLIDEGGYFLINPDDPALEWGKYLDNDYKLEEFIKDDFIKDTLFTQGKFFTIGESIENDHLHGYQKIRYNKSDPSKSWVLSLNISNNVFFANLNNLKENMFLANTFTFLVFAIIFIFFILQITKPIKVLNIAMKRVDRGDYNFDLKPTSKDEIGYLTERFSSFVKTIREQEKEKSEFITSASHQLKTPATGVSFQLHDLKKKLKEMIGSKEMIVILDDIINNNARALVITNDLFKLLELGDKYLASNQESINIKDLVVSTVDSFGEKIKTDKINVSVNIPEHLTVFVEEARFKEVLINLIDNAVKYSNKGGKISVDVKEDKGGIKFEIKDNGIGIPTTDKINIFTKFFRASNSYLKESVGSGLGLSIVKTIIKGHGGEVKFESEEGEGTVFWFTLPINK